MSESKPHKKWAWGLLIAALLTRLIALATQDAYLHPDALGQGLEPAFGAVWGEFERSWEFQDGARSWLWPAFLSLPMFALKWLGIAGPGLGMGPAIVAARLMCVAIDLAACALLVRHLQRQCGNGAALFAATALIVHPIFVIVASQALIDVPAAFALILAWTLAWPSDQAEPAKGSALKALKVGAALTFAFMLRLQLASAVAVLGLRWLWTQHKSGELKKKVTQAALGTAVVLVLFGVLDLITWGSWWHSLRTYLAFNMSEAGKAFGSMPADRYWEHFSLAAPYLRIPLVLLTLAGIWRRPWWGLLLLAFWLPHQVLEYRVWRFIHPGLFLLVGCAACGLGLVVEEITKRQVKERTPKMLVLAACIGLSASAVDSTVNEGLWKTTWAYAMGGDEGISKMRAMNRAALWLSQQEDRGALINQLLPEGAAPGRALFGHAGPRVHVLSGKSAAPGSQVRTWLISVDSEQDAQGSGLAVLWRDPDGVALLVGK